MSWQSWHQTPPPVPNAMAPVAMQAAVNANAAPPLVVPPAAAALSGPVQYSSEQWTQMQQQNWQQWAQWQQQYQQWHQQYGAEYQKSINALSAVGPNTTVPPPLPAEPKHVAPPPPPDNSKALVTSQYNAQPRPSSGYSTGPPTNQYSSAPPTQYPDQSQQEWKSSGLKRQTPIKADFEPNKRQMLAQPSKGGNSWQNQPPPSAQTPAQKAVNLEELTEAEKKFDKEFAAWEAQFNKWKEQNANHPDKSQYLEYEKKWDSWRNSLLDRREQMRKKRVALQASMTTSVATTPVPPPQQINFKQPPPLIGQSFLNSTGQLPVFDKPPPTHNNEPLNFKPPPSSEEASDVGGNSFLKSSSPAPGGIPGLDLVREDSTQEANDPPVEQKEAAVVLPKGPDLDAISRGINTILGDAKLLNMLSMVTQNQKVQAGVGEHERKAPEPVSAQARPNLGEYTEQLETVNNFDDQTRMSFSNGPNDPDSGSNFRRLGPTDYRSGFRNNNFESHQDQNEFRNFNRSGFNGDNSRLFPVQSRSRFANSSDYHDTYRNRYEEEGNNDDQWNEEDEYDKYHDMFNEDERSMDDQPDRSHLDAVEPEQVADEQPFFVPELVVDYEHKSLKEPEPEVSLDVIRTFDYRHKPVSRIPYPQRPEWLANTLRNIHQFKILTPVRLHMEREPPSRYPLERVDHYSRRANYEETKAFSRDAYEGRLPYNDRDRFGYEYDQRGRTAGFPPERRAETKNRVEKKVPDANRFQNSLDLEELSDDDWENEKNSSQKSDASKFLPAHRTIDLTTPPNTTPSNQFTTLEDIINAPGRFSRPQKIAIILRGPPGSGKTYLAKLIKDREVENGGSAPRILSLDDYFMVEHEKTVIEDGKLVKIKEMTYEYEAAMEESYRQCLIKAFKKTVIDGYFPFVVVDNVNQKVKNFGEMWSFAKQNGFQVFICQLDLDPVLCTKRNIHHRSESYIENCIAGWEPTPAHHPLIDATNFLQSTGAIMEVEMEEADQDHDPSGDDGEEHTRSKWDSFDCSLNNLARLDGVSKPLRPSRTMEEYLQLDDEWEQPENPTKPGQKRVRWADLEEQKQQKKMKALGFVVGQTDWQRIMDPTNGESALTQTKYIERRFNK